MTPKSPKTELDARYSSALNPRPGAEAVTATDWAEAQRRLRDAELFWITTVRPDGRLHVTPLIAAWHDGALHFSTGPGSRRPRTWPAIPTAYSPRGTTHSPKESTSWSRARRSG